jgi:hypothetical protein
MTRRKPSPSALETALAAFLKTVGSSEDAITRDKRAGREARRA